MRLLPIDRFEVVFGRYVGSSIRLGLVDGDGNAGDRLIYAATRQIMQEFGLKWRTINMVADPPESYRDDVDELLLFGGGSMGLWAPMQRIRQKALSTGIPCTILPQTWGAAEPGDFLRQFIREEGSRVFCPHGILAPDLALGYDWPEVAAPTKGKGVFLKTQGLYIFDLQRWPIGPNRQPDPCEGGVCYTATDYIKLVSQYKHIVTDRVHLAITALGLGRRITLLPYGYHKNSSLWVGSLRALGCEWANRPEEA